MVDTGQVPANTVVGMMKEIGTIPHGAMEIVTGILVLLLVVY